MSKLFRILILFLFFLHFNPNVNAQAVIDAGLQQAMLNTVEPLEVVVTFNGDGSPSSSNVTLLNQVGILKGFTFKSLPIAGVLATPSQISALAQSSQVRSLYLNSELEYYNYNGTALTGVDRLRTDQNFTVANGGFPVSGKGVTVMVHDSGIEGTHDDIKFGNNLKQNVLGTTNPHAYDDLLPIVYIEDVINTDNNSGHGTHVAGTVGGRGIKSAGKYEGVAPGADLVGYGSGGVLLILDAIGGFDYAITNQFEYDIKVITNSWGGGGTFNPAHPVNVASKKAYDVGMIVLFAAGNSGPFEWSLTRYAAPWVITVAAGNKFGSLADFSSRGLKDDNWAFELNGSMWQYENRPTITAPGVSVTSTRAVSPLGVVGTSTNIEPAYQPYYTNMSGTSMATPHVAGIVALMLDANPLLTFEEVKDILQQTATNMPGYESWETGAGYVNAYAAVHAAFGETGYGASVNMYRNFNSNINAEITRTPYVVDFNPVIPLSSDGNGFNFEVPAGLTSLEAISFVHGITGEEGNPLDLVLTDPNGNTYNSLIYVAFPLYHDRAVGVVNPVPGTWNLKYVGLATLNPLITTPALPEEIHGYLKFIKVLGSTGLNDIAGHPAESSIKLAVTKRLADGNTDGNFYPDAALTRADLADYFGMGQGVRQALPTNGIYRFNDVSGDLVLFSQSATNRGSVLRDMLHQQDGVVRYSGSSFNPAGTVNRAGLAYSLVQALGLQSEAQSHSGNVTVTYSGQQYIVEDQNQIPAELKGYVQAALNLNLMSVYWTITQDPFGLNPILHANFKPLQTVTRGEFAVTVTRTHDQWNAGGVTKGSSGTNQPAAFELEQNYPNPFNPATTINYSIAQEGLVNLSVYNMLGEKIATLVNGKQPAGSYSIPFDASSLASGIYLYKITSGSFEKTMKMNLIK